MSKANNGANTQLDTFLVQPFDLGMHATNTGVAILQSRMAAWLSGLRQSARFVYWLIPASLDDKISALSHIARDVKEVSPVRSELAMEYRRHYELLQDSRDYQRSLCGLGMSNVDNTRAMATGISVALETPCIESQWPALFQGQYRIKNTPFGHWSPIGRPGGRLLWVVLTSYEFLPAEWNYFRPWKALLSFNFPLAVAVDIPQTHEPLEGTDAVESTMLAYQVHLATLRGGKDSRAEQRLIDCQQTVNELNGGDALHRVQISIAIAAPDLKTLKDRIATVINQTRAWVLFREETGPLLQKSMKLFSPIPSQSIKMPDTTWPVVSRELALLLAPLGYPKLSSTDGVMRGESVEGRYPIFHNSWKDKRAVHEIWVGQSGYGKTFMLNCYLMREFTENGIPFDLLEPMGHGKLLADAIGVPIFNLSARTTTLNPQDIVYDSVEEQISHVVRLYETVLKRSFEGSQEQNLERSLLAEALENLYRGFRDLNDIAPTEVPTVSDLCATLEGLGGESNRRRKLAVELADEIKGLCTGRGPWARFLDGPTNVNLSRRGQTSIGPRIFSFKEMKDDPIILALAYTQILSAIRRDSLIDEQPRIIAVDEVYRLMMFPALLDFLIEAAKTFRTRRKKLISIDQQMMFFLEGKARYVFENCPIRVVFSQRNGMQVFEENAAFQHLNRQHLETIRNLGPFHYVLDIQDEGIHYVHNNPSEGEHQRFRSS